MDSIDFDRNMNDLANNFELMERAVKRLGILLVDDHGYLLGGRPSQCVDLLRKLLLFTSTVVAKQMLLRGCPSHAPDKRVVISAFDLIREKMRYSPTITVDQFCKDGFAPHKMLVLAKAAEYVQWADNKTFCRGGPTNKITYVVPPDSISPTITGAEYQQQQQQHHHQYQSPESNSRSPSSFLRSNFSSNPNRFTGSPSTSTTAAAAADDSSYGAEATEGQWRLTDFIKANIMDKRQDSKRSYNNNNNNSGNNSNSSNIRRSAVAVAAGGEILKAPSFDRQGRPVLHHPVRLRSNSNSSNNNNSYSSPMQQQQQQQQQQLVRQRSGSGSAAAAAATTRMRSRSEASTTAAAAALRSNSRDVIDDFNYDATDAFEEDNYYSNSSNKDGNDTAAADDDDGADGIMGYRPMRPSPSRSFSSDPQQQQQQQQQIRGSRSIDVTTAAAAASNSSGNNNNSSRSERGLRPETQLAAEIDELIESRLHPQQFNNNNSSSSNGSQQQQQLFEFIDQRLSEHFQSPAFLRVVDERLEKRLQQQETLDSKVEEAMRKVTQKYDFVINKLVGAVDAEFTLLTNRVKMLELELQGADVINSSAAATTGGGYTGIGMGYDGNNDDDGISNNDGDDDFEGQQQSENLLGEDILDLVSHQQQL